MSWIQRAMSVLATIEETQQDALDAASSHAAASIGAGGVVFTFGTGHSRIPVEEMFPRYGSFPGFLPITELSTTFYTQVAGANGMRQAMFLENVEGLAARILANYAPRSIDSALVFSAGGHNAVPVEMAQELSKAGVTVIAVTSMRETMAGPPRHSGGTRLCDHADIVIDLCTPVGDALCQVEGLSTPVGPGTTLAAVAVVNEIKVRTARLLTAAGAPPPVITGARLVGADRSEQLFEAAYLEHARRAAQVLRGAQ